MIWGYFKNICVCRYWGHWGQILNFEAATSKICNHFWKFGCRLEELRHTSVWQTVPKFWFIWLWHYSFCIACVVIEAIKFKEWSRLNLRVSLLRPLRSNLKFWGSDLEILQSFLKVWLPTRKSKTDLCMTNSSKVLIYLTLISFFLQYLQEYVFEEQ